MFVLEARKEERVASLAWLPDACSRCQNAPANTEVGCLSLNSKFLQSKWVQESLKSRTEHFQVHLLNLGHTLEVTFLVLRTSARSAPL